MPKHSKKKEVRLYTKNFRRVKSHAATTIDYDPKAKIIEIEFKTGEIYHYCDAKRSEWNKMIEFAAKKEGLGTYVNQVFKKPYYSGERKFYKLDVIPEHSDV